MCFVFWVFSFCLQQSIPVLAFILSSLLAVHNPDSSLFLFLLFFSQTISPFTSGCPSLEGTDASAGEDAPCPAGTRAKRSGTGGTSTTTDTMSTTTWTGTTLRLGAWTRPSTACPPTSTGPVSVSQTSYGKVLLL